MGLARRRSEIGTTYGNLLAVSHELDRLGGSRSLYLCECGKEVVHLDTRVLNGVVKSCGCGELRTTHGKSTSTEYYIWTSLKGRCLNPSNEAYSNYGGRGITVCEEWAKSFEAFYSDMGPRPSKNHSLDRIDPDGNYELGNCRWADSYTQATNQRHNASVQGVIREKNREIARLKKLLQEAGIQA
jgi:hypothetical protein